MDKITKIEVLKPSSMVKVKIDDAFIRMWAHNKANHDKELDSDQLTQTIYAMKDKDGCVNAPMSTIMEITGLSFFGVINRFADLQPLQPKQPKQTKQPEPIREM